MSGVVSAGGDYHILDIYCQQLWNVVQLGVSVFVLRAHNSGMKSF